MKNKNHQSGEYNIKSDNQFEFSLIAQYKDYLSELNTSEHLEDRCIKDLEIDNFFKFIDRTYSAIGQQYLYNHILDIDCSENSFTELEEEIAFYSEKNDQNIEVKQILSKLSKGTDYYFPYLIFSELPTKMKYFYAIKILQILVFVLAILSIFWNYLVLPLIIILTINMIIHYWHKNRVGNFIEYFFRINVLTKNCRKLNAISENKDEQIISSVKRVEKLSASISYLKTDSLQESEFGAILWYALELIKIATLGEVILFHKIVDHITEQREDIHKLYKYIGEIDMAVSIGLLRSSLPYYSKPIFVNGKKEITFSELYHPLISDCVSNDLHLSEKSMLLTGSNMSGKSTFIKSIGLNAIASQTMNTSFSKEYIAPIFALSTSIKIDDNLQENKSYYQEEVVTIGNMLELSNTKNTQYLFIIDEVFKGTNTIERISGGKAILSYLNKGNHIVLVATHDVELTNLLDEEYGLFYFQESVGEKKLSFDYKLMKGQIKKLNAIKIMEISGYPSSIVEEAKQLAKQLEREKTGVRD